MLKGRNKAINSSAITASVSDCAPVHQFASDVPFHPLSLFHFFLFWWWAGGGAGGGSFFGFFFFFGPWRPLPWVFFYLVSSQLFFCLGTYFIDCELPGSQAGLGLSVGAGFLFLFSFFFFTFSIYCGNWHSQIRFHH